MSPNDLPKAFFGPGSSMTESAWSAMPDHDPDDEDMPKTPSDVTALLGFDPKTEEGDQNY